MKAQKTLMQLRQDAFTLAKKNNLSKIWSTTIGSVLFFTFFTFQGCSNSSSFHQNAVPKKTTTTPTTGQTTSQNGDSTAENSIGGNAPASSSSATSVAGTASEPNPATKSISKEPFQPCAANGMASATQPIVAKVYELRKGAASIAEKAWDQTMYRTKICMTAFDVPERIFTDGFPGIPNLFEWFGIDARAKLMIPTSGSYKFRVLSDDGSILTIDNQVVIDHDGQHSPSSKDGTVQLTQGIHELKVVYFQGPANQIALQLFWTPPGSAEEIVPTSAFRPSEF
ncbi:MAG: PA14 domain-containing protein [Pseudomonadota bacterium]